jgi:thioredoxin reductase (NADPH)
MATDLIIIGQGIAGLTAARLAAQQGKSVTSIEGYVFGGLVLNVNELDGEPEGSPTGSGAEFSSNLLGEIGELGVESVNENVTGLERAGSVLRVTTDQGSHEARAVVVASGAKIRKLGVPGEEEFQDRGVASCADCDGPMYQGQTVVVVGGGDSALQEALVLAGYAKEVRIVHRGAAFRAQKHLADAVAAKGNIQVNWNSFVEAILGSEGVTGVRVKRDGVLSDISCSGVFAYPGLEPASGFLPAEIQRTGDGLVITDAAMRTALPGVMAIGAVRAGYGGMLTHAMAEAEVAVGALKDLLR